MRWPVQPSSTHAGADTAGPARRLWLLSDEFLESYVRWREACEDVRTAYTRWCECEPARRALAFKVYCAALDWEEHTADVHAERAQQLHLAMS